VDRKVRTDRNMGTEGNLRLVTAGVSFTKV